jgi:hypothetical protein
MGLELVCEDTDEGDHLHGGQRGHRGLVDGPAEKQREQRNEDDAAAEAEEATNDARREADKHEA